ncbi:MAG: HAD-superfamily hydrolase, subfamily IA, variant 3 [Candidatus Nomurabacteria bacterium GW2011_GWA2_40_97]|nr:MAG: HAD-superfamily hydrolase, subfamily IA, variant 3 [Candidatus Nomurabacteria bacterium GW2011_GWA2_40_97]
MIKVVIFDADGLLTNQERFSVALEKDYGITIEKTLPFFNGPFQDCLVGKCDLKETISPYLTLWGWNKGLDAFMEYWFEREHKKNSFDKTYSSAHLGHKKPNQEFFLKIFEDLKNIQKEEILFWDDTAGHIQGAKDFGIQTELYTSFEDFKEKMKQYMP